MKQVFTILFASIYLAGFGQSLNGLELLEKSIKYHDPKGTWEKFEGQLNFEQERPNSKEREIRTVKISLPQQYFQLIDQDGDNTIIREVNVDQCASEYNGSKEFSEEVDKKYRLNCDRAKMYRDYYSYLYGLPMKLKDPGTNIEEAVRDTEFQGKESWAIRVTYDAAVGDDIWYFYFDKTSYAMIGYRFYHEEAKNDGEYITLEGEEVVEGIKIPKDRYWYYNKDDKFLGADFLMSGSKFERK